MVDDILYCIVILILLIELIKLINRNAYECFSTAPTNNILSDYPENNSSDKFANYNEEILLMTQYPNGTRKYNFTYIRAPLNNWIIIYVKSNKSGQLERISNFAPMQIKSSNYKVLNLLGNSNYLMRDAAPLMYYIKFLDSRSYQYEINLINEKNKVKDKFQNCLATNAILPKSQAIDKCKTILS